MIAVRLGGWRIAAMVLLGVEVLWWGGSITLTAGAITSPLLYLWAVVPAAFVVLTVLAIYLIVEAPRAGIWLGLALQVPVALETVLFLIMSFIGIFVAVPLALITAVCLALGWPKSPAR